MIADVIPGKKQLMIRAIDFHGDAVIVHMKDAWVAADHATNPVLAQKAKCISSAQGAAGTFFGHRGAEKAGGQGTGDGVVSLIQKNFAGQCAIYHLSLLYIAQDQLEKAVDAQQRTALHAGNSRHGDAHGGLAPQPIHGSIKGEPAIQKLFQRAMGAKKIDGRRQDQGIGRGNGLQDDRVVVVNHTLSVLEKTLITSSAWFDVKIRQP